MDEQRTVYKKKFSFRKKSDQKNASTKMVDPLGQESTSSFFNFRSSTSNGMPFPYTHEPSLAPASPPTSSFMFKIIIGGAAAVGKTTLLHRYIHGVFLEGSTMTIGVGFHAKDYVHAGNHVKLSLWDLGGQQRFRFMQSNYSAGARAAIVFFDASRPHTSDQVNDWVSLFRAHASPDVLIVLCSNKSDLVDPETAKDVHKLGLETVARLDLSRYFSTSSKTGENVENVFSYLVDALIAPSQASKALVATEYC